MTDHYPPMKRCSDCDQPFEEDTGNRLCPDCNRRYDRTEGAMTDTAAATPAEPTWPDPALMAALDDGLKQILTAEVSRLTALNAAMLAALEAITEHRIDRVDRTPEEVAEAEACPNCQRLRAQSWPPRVLCPTHERVYYHYVHINELAEKYHDLDLVHIARAAIAQARGGEKVQGG